MTNNNEYDLLSDLARLVKKYGPETFETLASQLSRPDFIYQLAEIISTTAKASRIARPRKAQGRTTKPRVDFRTSLVELGESEPDKSVMLVQLLDGLMSKAFLPTLRDVRAFVQDNGLPLVKAKTRDKTIVPLVKSLLPMPTEEISMLLRKIQPTQVRNDRSLAGWSDIILRRGEQVK
ncbi:MAG: hypothetical protein ABW208_13430 [Pyrinomonadaceae bacterium]